jgi:hypothetical protein
MHTARFFFILQDEGKRKPSETIQERAHKLLGRLQQPISVQQLDNEIKHVESMRSQSSEEPCIPSSSVVATSERVHFSGRAPLPRQWEHYRGDWMERPMMSTEIGSLARVLVDVSKVLNKRLRLEGHEEPQKEWLKKRRREGWRINLRPLAEAETLVCIGLVVVVLGMVSAGIRAIVRGELSDGRELIT